MTLATPVRTWTICSPRWATRRRPERPTFGTELADIARSLGQPFMPHQRLIAEIGGEYNPVTGIPYYREVVVTLPRQHGKTTLYLSWQLHRCLAKRWAHPQRSAFTAQSGKDARDKFLDELFPLIRSARKLKPFIRRINEGMGNESIRFTNGSLIRLLSTSTSSGHSKTLHQAALDEIWHDQDDRRQQGLRPAMITVADAQLLVCSTAGTDESVVLNGKVEAGRAAVEQDLGEGVAYFEFSAPDDWDPDDDESFFGFMPALCPDPPCRCGVGDGGWRHTITLDALRAERQAMKASEFARAYGNRKQSSAVQKTDVVDAAAWEELADPDGRPDAVAFALVVSRDRTVAYIAYAGRWGADGDLVKAGLADRLTDVPAAGRRLVEMAGKWRPIGVSVSARSENLLLDLQKLGLKAPDDPEVPQRGNLRVPSAADDTAAYGLLVDKVGNRTLRHADDLPVNAALELAQPRLGSGGGQTWDDKAGDMAAVRAVAHALWLWESWAHLVEADYDPMNEIF